MSDATYATKIYEKPGGDEMIVASGGIINIETGGKLQNNGIDMDLSAGIATATSSTTAELDKLHSVTGGTASASKAVVLDANKGVTGLGAVGSLEPVATASGDGAITIAPGLVKITKGSAAALTLADPAAGDEGTVIRIVSTTAFAHTISNAAGSGFNAGGAGSDVATLGGALGDGLTVVALGSKWYVLGSINATLG